MNHDNGYILDSRDLRRFFKIIIIILRLSKKT